MANYYVIRIPEQYQSKLSAKIFKISLKKVGDEEIENVKNLLRFKVQEIFRNEELQTKKRSVDYLKLSVDIYINNKSIKDFNSIDQLILERFKTQLKNENIITIQSIILKAIIEREKVYKRRNEYLSKLGVDTKIKIDSTLGAYKAILKSVNDFFGKDFLINNLNSKNVKDYSFEFKNDTYIAHLKSIFEKEKENDDSIVNHFKLIKYAKYEKPRRVKNKKIFYFNEIENILNELETKEQKEELKQYFLVLLHTGMRGDELASIKKINIGNDCFYFQDSKSYFDKIVPVHHDFVEYINNKIENLEDDDYLFFNKNRSSRRVSQIRDKFNSLNSFKQIKKTLHITRKTFVTYINFYCSTFNENYTRGLTHKNEGIDQETYNKALNLDILKEIINKIDLKNLDKIEEQIKLTENRFLKK